MSATSSRKRISLPQAKQFAGADVLEELRRRLALRHRVHLRHVLERVRVGAADHRDVPAVLLLHVLDELLHHLVVERRHGAVQHLEDVEHLQQLGDVARRDVLHPVVLEEVVDRRRSAARDFM